MFELIKINDNDYYIDCPAKIGLIKIDSSNVILIDSGSDKDAAKKILKILDSNNWNLKAIYNTHSHADHIGGNNYLQEKTQCNIYANSLENSYINNPILEPITLYGGMPFHEIENKFLKAQNSNSILINNITLPSSISIIELPGHSVDMVGYITKDGTAYIGDSISSVDTLSKYGIGYLWNYNDSLKTLEKLKTISANVYVPAHSNVTNDISTLIDYNINSIINVKNTIMDILHIPLTFETLLKQILDKYYISLNIQQYVLIGSTIRSYLSALYSESLIRYEINDNYIYWVNNTSQ